MGWLRGCFGFLVLARVVLVAAYGGWRWGDAVFSGLGPDGGGTAAAREAADPELARRTLERMDAFRAGESSPDGDGELVLGEAEVASVIRYGAPDVLPAGVAEPTLELRGGRLRIDSRVAVSEVPSVPELERVLGILPDTVPVTLDASLMPFGERGAALVVHRLRASGVPVPRRVIPPILTALGRRDEPGLPPDAISVPLPAGVRTAYILADSLILVAAR